MLKRCNVLIFCLFTTVETKIWVPLELVNKEWNNLGVRAMVAEIRPRLATNVIFTTVVVSLLILKYKFSRLRFCNQDPLLTDIRFYRAPVAVGG